MAFRLKPGRSARKQFARIIRKELERAADEMQQATHQIDAVHNARKRVKKIRAILHLLRSSLGHAYRTYNGQLRTVAHQLSAPRDADAALEIMRAVHIHYPRLVTRALFNTVRQGLTPKQRGAARRFNPTRVQRELRHAAKALPRRIRRAANPPTIEAGITQGYSRARRGMGDVKATPEDVCFHAWRRRVKDHWYQMRLLETVHPPVRLRIRRLKQLEQWLGDDHNLGTATSDSAGRTLGLRRRAQYRDPAGLRGEVPGDVAETRPEAGRAFIQDQTSRCSNTRSRGALIGRTLCAYP